MSDHSLPDDVNHWPRDPFVLLGIARGTSEREVKRAYTRLIKKYKPDSHPVEFRKLRDAYEAITRRAGFSIRLPNEDRVVLDTAASLWETKGHNGADDADEEPEHSANPLEESPASGHHGRRIQGAWRIAIGGDIPRAYAKLVDLNVDFPDDEDVLLRLYWLLKLAPETDPDRSPTEWLVDGVIRSGMASRAGALYRQHLDADPAEARAPRCDRVLASLQRPGDILDLVERRWCARASTVNVTGATLAVVEMVVRDWHAVRDRLRRADELAWGRALLLAINHLLWCREPHRDQALADLRRELDAAQHLGWQLGYDFDNLDAAAVAAEEWRREYRYERQHRQDHYGLKGDVLRLTRLSWLQSPAAIRDNLARCVRRILDAPLQALDDLHRLEQFCPAVVARFLGVLEGIPTPPSNDAADPGWLRSYVTDFALACKWYEYPRFRRVLYGFCTREAISPACVAENLAGDRRFITQKGFQLAQGIATDVALETVYRCWKVFWAL